MIEADEHHVIHWTNVDHRIARHAATTVASFVAACHRRIMKPGPRRPDSPSGVVRFASTYHSMEVTTRSGDLTCTMQSRVPGDLYEITVSIPMIWAIEGDPIGDDPTPTIEHLHRFVEIARAPACMMGDKDEFLGLPGSDETGLRILALIDEATADALACWNGSGRPSPRLVRVTLPLLDRIGRIVRTEEPGMGSDARANPMVDERASIAAIVATLPAMAVLYKDGPTHFHIRSHFVEPKMRIPDAMETMRRLAAISARDGHAS
jgi:hypothetical protein